MQTRAVAWLLMGGVAVLGAAGCGGPTGSEARAVTVFAAISVTDSLRALAARFESQTGVHVTLNLSGSNTLATQVLNGAPADVFLSADTEQMNRIAAAGMLDPETVTPLLSNRLVLIVPSSSTFSMGVPADLAGPAIKRLAIGDPAAVPAGHYAMAYLKARGIWPRVESRLVHFPHVRAVSAAVEQGAADAGFVYRTDARVASQARVALEVDEDPRWKITYPIAVLRRAPHGALARQWITFLRQSESLKVFSDAGFIVVANGAGG